MDGKEESDPRWKEFRLGRKLFFRKVIIDKDIQIEEHTKTVHILFVHGSCASSKQFDSLINSIQNNICKYQGGNIKIVCYLYDQFGCGESKKYCDVKDWEAFSSVELDLDLQAVTEFVLNEEICSGNKTSNEKNEFYISGHSYGVSQTIKLLQNKPTTKGKVNGVILLSGALKSPNGGVTQDGGHWVFRYFPLWLLKKLQPGMSEEFVQRAFHPSNLEKFKESALKICNQNDMNFVRAFYRQQKYATVEETKSSLNDDNMRTLLIHGRDDMILPVSCSEQIYTELKVANKISSNSLEFHIINNASHQVFEETPDDVASLIMNFIAK
eukprot:CAMPEP_0178961940 /NCGR_PEP_ID=MMETSP0789-20121207/14041_1 /TAXON_ID=3005 /ORGANISM="Rhizosolenia setigera, Strain CCMP 1694" /LENGTH=325 /DNA_ID=CAMNT_0020645941 /DNA_START=18 /DNA_END=995 /DNA_ORIENTATION=+